jgi:hypothetical protein
MHSTDMALPAYHRYWYSNLCCILAVAGRTFLSGLMLHPDDDQLEGRNMSGMNCVLIQCTYSTKLYVRTVFMLLIWLQSSACTGSRVVQGMPVLTL